MIPSIEMRGLVPMLDTIVEYADFDEEAVEERALIARHAIYDLADALQYYENQPVYTEEDFQQAFLNARALKNEVNHIGYLLDWVEHQRVDLTKMVGHAAVAMVSARLHGWVDDVF